MDLLIGIYETKLVDNTIQIPSAWCLKAKTHTVYCALDTYESEDDEILTKIICAFERDDHFEDVNDSEVFTTTIDRRKRIRVPKKFIDKCGFETNAAPILLIGWECGFMIQTKRYKIKQEDIDELERIIHEI